MTDAILTCSEHFTDLALNEIRRHHPQLTCVRRISPQHLYISNPGSFGKLIKPWKKKLPIYVHHLFPVHKTVPLSGCAADFVELRNHAQDFNAVDFTVQTRIATAYQYSPSAILQYLAPTQLIDMSSAPQGRILSILIDAQTAYMGMSWASQNISPYIGGQQFFHEPVRNRAGLKLLEAMNTFQLRLTSGAHALDLGAAPGAWTEILRRRGLRITAVAPQPMYDWLDRDPDVDAYELTAEAFAAQCNTVFDLIVNDMRMDAQYSARVMVDYARNLRSGGIAIMTLKLRLRNTRRVIDHSLRILRKNYKILAIRQLVYNRKEVTLFLRRRE